MTQAQMTSAYEQARARLLRKRKFRGDMVAYLVINAFFRHDVTEDDILREKHRPR